MSFAKRGTRIFLTSVFLSTCSAEWALVNIIRHGERYDEKTHGGHLHPMGYERAEYIAKCVMNPAPTLAFPLGRPSQLLASYGHHSFRPMETLKPLSIQAGIPLDTHIGYEDVDEFAAFVNKLHHGQTLFVAWQHKLIPNLFKPWLGDEAPKEWPEACPYEEWIEPGEFQGGACYDIIWQMALYRHNHNQKWEAQAFTQLHAGFSGSRNAPCLQAFRPYSDPAHWIYPPKNQSGATQLNSEQPARTETSAAAQAYTCLFGFASASLFWALLWAKSMSKLTNGANHHEPLLRGM